MEKLSALDANFLYTETEKMPNHISSVQLFDLPDETTADEFIVGLKSRYLERIHLVPYLTRKVVFMPGNIDHPVWKVDADFNIDNHIIKVDLPPPGNFHQLEEKVAEIHAELIDRNRPLWQLFVISGLEGNRIAYYSQAHHACIDGMAGQAATFLLLDTTPEGRDIEPPKNFPQVDNGGLPELLERSLENFIMTQVSAPKRILDAMENLTRLTQRMFDGEKKFGAVTQRAPKTRFNKSIEKPRTYAVADFTLKEFIALAKATNSKVNDVLLNICAGGLRQYLLDIDELPEDSLIAGCPVSLRKPGDESMNNQVTMMNVALSTDIEDPDSRLEAIKASAKTAKEIVSETQDNIDMDISVFGMPLMMTNSARMSETLHLMDNVPTPMNLVISNVPGPPMYLYSNGAKMLTHYPVSIPAHGMGVNITAVSYADNFHLAITACASALPDATKLRDDILHAYEDMTARALKTEMIPERREPHQVSKAERSAKPGAVEETETPKIA
jgi:WS/DGAT/MGAT family acyltransferase